MHLGVGRKMSVGPVDTDTALPRLELRLQLVRGQRFGDLDVELWWLHADQPVGIELALFDKPLGEPAHAKQACACGCWLGAGGEHGVDELGDLTPVQHGRLGVLIAPAQVRPYAVAVGLQRLRGLAFGPQGQFPRRQQRR